MLLADNLKSLRTARGLTQQQLAGALGIGQSTIGMIESRKREVGLDILQKMADFFSVSTDFLLFGFEKSRIVNLINAARLGRTVEQFARDVGLDAGYLEALCKGDVSGPPSPEIIKKIMDDEDSRVLSDYYELMEAGGHMDHQTALELRLGEIKKGAARSGPAYRTTFAASRTDGYDAELPEEARRELNSYVDYLRAKYKKKESGNK